ncbi:MAG: ATP phosphoribosyltransferase regulatory subunit [Nitrospirae bacterium]|nr:ATP phosphoribosyltransferase regulatory subunit [Nitrospirota bacterium]
MLTLNRTIKSITPKGVGTFFPERAAKKRWVEESLLSVFLKWGFQEIVTPGFEYLDVLSEGLDEELIDKSYKFVDRGTGRILVLRPDITSQIARIAATSLAEKPGPMRICYSANVFRYEEEHAGRQREIFQIGGELLGIDLPEADAEMIAIAVESLKKIGLRDFEIAMGHIGFFKGMLNGFGLDSQTEGRVRDAFSKKEMLKVEGLLTGFNKAKRGRFLKISELFGKEEILDRAEAICDNKESRAAIRNIMDVYRILKLYGLDEYILIDLTEARGFDYYSGILFEVFVRGIGYEIGNGGRYDGLLSRFGQPSPATGFAFDVERLIAAMEAQGIEPENRGVDFLIIDFNKDKSNAIKLAKALRENGYNAARDIIKRDIKDSLSYAKEWGIPKVIVLGSRELKKDEALLIDTESDKKKRIKIEQSFI